LTSRFGAEKYQIAALLLIIWGRNKSGQKNEKGRKGEEGRVR